MYGACLKRLINWACAARLKYPDVAIYASKVDIKSAYRRCHLHPATAVQTCTQIDLNEEEKLLLMFLCLTFGGAPGPNEWSVLAEPMCDLSTALMQDENWDPSALASPSQKIVPPAIRESAEMSCESKRGELGIGREMIVDIEVNHRGVYC